MQTPTQTRSKQVDHSKGSNGKDRDPLKCQDCVEPHLLINFTYNLISIRNLQNVQESSIVNDMGWNLPCISVALEEHQGNHHLTIMEVEGKNCKQTLLVLIDWGASLSYISPKIIENCKLVIKNFKTPWPV